MACFFAIKHSLDLFIVQSLEEIEAKEFYHTPFNKVKGIEVEIAELCEQPPATIVQHNVLKVILLLAYCGNGDTTQTELGRIDRHILELCASLIAAGQKVVVHHIAEICIVVSPFFVCSGRYKCTLMVHIHKERH